MCILPFITFLDKRSSVHLRIAIISGRNIVEGLPIWILSHGYPLDYKTKLILIATSTVKGMTKCFWLQNSEWQLLPNKMNKMVPCGKYLFIARTFTSVSWLIETLIHLSTELLTYIISTIKWMKWMNNDKIRNPVLKKILKLYMNIMFNVNCGLC
jgi:hypothetical protein